MSPVHVVISEDQQHEQQWAGAFAGAAECYRFPTNVDAFERLTAAQAPIDLLVITPHQTSVFNMTPDQLLARIFDSPLASSPCLRNMHVIVVGSQVRTPRPQVACVSQLDAAIRLVKFGEVEQAPMPAPAPVAAPHGSSNERAASPQLDTSPLVGSIISRIWDAPDAAANRNGSPHGVRGGGAAPAARSRQRAASSNAAPVSSARQPRPAAGPQLFATPPRQRVMQPAAVGGGGASASTPGASASLHAERVQVASSVAPPQIPLTDATPLQPVRPAVLPNGAGYRGPGIRAGHIHGGASYAGAQQTPPALQAQIQHLVGRPSSQLADPLLGFSRSNDATNVRDAIATTPMQPPRGAVSNDPLMRRAEGGAGASFG